MVIIERFGTRNSLPDRGLVRVLRAQSKVSHLEDELVIVDSLERKFQMLLYSFLISNLLRKLVQVLFEFRYILQQLLGFTFVLDVFYMLIEVSFHPEQGRPQFRRFACVILYAGDKLPVESLNESFLPGSEPY